MTTLFTSEYLGRLERFVMASRAAISSPMTGRRPGLGKGFSVEFADYRVYHPGDDLRYVDWNVYRRMGKLFLRLFRAESELTLHVLVDTSRSMGYGAADKLDFTRRVAAALAFVGVSNQDRVSLATFSNKLHTVIPAGRGRPHLFRLFETLESVQPEGKSDLTCSLREYADYSRTSGLAVVLSDCFDPGGYEGRAPVPVPQKVRSGPGPRLRGRGRFPRHSRTLWNCSIWRTPARRRYRGIPNPSNDTRFDLSNSGVLWRVSARPTA